MSPRLLEASNLRSTQTIDSVTTVLPSSLSSSSSRRRPRAATNLSTNTSTATATTSTARTNDNCPSMRMIDETLLSSPFSTYDPSLSSSSYVQPPLSSREHTGGTKMKVSVESQSLEPSEQEEEGPLSQRRLCHTSSSSSLLSLQQQNHQRHQHKRHQQSWFILAWSIHFISSILVLIYGTHSNQGARKYIPIDASKAINEGQDCDKAFIDVFSSAFEDPGALVCCRPPHTQSWSDSSNSIGIGISNLDGDDTLNPLICTPPPIYLPFARRLAKFPDAWILPLFPLLVRGVVHWYNWHALTESRGPSSTDALRRQDNVYSKRRLYLYLGLIQVRGWILYIALDALEDWFVSSSGTRVQEDKGCWYEGYLYADYERCQGRAMDFSDHVVLYFAQIIPIALVEILHALLPPSGYKKKHHHYYHYYWWLGWPAAAGGGGGGGRQRQGQISKYNGVLRRFVPLVLSLWLVNLYVVTFLGAFKTAAYFHTGPEVWLGFIISLVIQVPLCLLQTTEAFSKQREYFFGF